MSKDDLVKLAHQPDYVVADVIGSKVHCKIFKKSIKLWDPEGNLDQAFEVLEGLDLPYTTEKIYSREVSYLVVVDPKGSNHGRFGDTLSKAICNVALRVLQDG